MYREHNADERERADWRVALLKKQNRQRRSQIIRRVETDERDFHFFSSRGSPSGSRTIFADNCMWNLAIVIPPKSPAIIDIERERERERE